MAPRTATAEPELKVSPEQAKSVGIELEANMTSMATRMVSSLAVVDIASCQQAVDDRKEIGEAIKRVKSWFKNVKDPVYQAWRVLCDRENETIKPLETADATLRAAIQKFTDEEERRRREREREEAEERRRQEQEHKTAVAAQLEAEGQSEMADAVLEEAIAAPAPVVTLPSVKQQVQGLKTKRVYRWRYTVDLAKTLAVIPRDYCTVDERRVSKMVEAAKGNIVIPGITVWHEDVPVR